MRKICYSLVLLVLASCGSRDTDFFNGEIIGIEDNAMEKEVEFKSVDIDGLYDGIFVVYDSLAIARNTRYSTCWYQVFNLNTFKEVGQFLRIGHGHYEFTEVGLPEGLFVENNELKSLIYELNVEKLSVWNITKSVADKSTVIERVFKLPRWECNEGYTFSPLFVKDSAIYARSVSASSGDRNFKETILPHYQIRNLRNGEKIDEIPVFKKPIYTTRTLPGTDFTYIIQPSDFFLSSDVMKPDRSKIAQAMSNIPQLNIIDTETRRVVGYRLDYGISLSELEKTEKWVTYFSGICADDNYIYVVFIGGDQMEFDKIPLVNQIYVFDWDGHLVGKVKTKHNIRWMDVGNNVLYTTSFTDEKLYYINTDELIGDTHS